jgi:hypothetical protein
MLFDKDGNICVIGHTTSVDFPVTSGAYDTSYTVTSYYWDYDVYITILTPELDEVVASTYIGGSDSDCLYLIRGTIDNNGNIIISGVAISYDFPMTPNAYQTTGGNPYIAKLSPDLSELLASTYFGGNYGEDVRDIRVDKYNNIIVCGWSSSPNYPTTPTAYNTTQNGDGDVYISKFGTGLDTLIASTLFGGASFDVAYSMDFDSSGNIYISGRTESYDLPTTTGAFDTTFNLGFFDGFISLFDPQLENLIASTFLGSSDWDDSRDLLYDNSIDEVFITGLAGGADFPVTTHAYDTSFNGDSDMYISRMSADLSRLIASTFIGGSTDDFGLELIVSEDGNIYVGGNTYSNDYPTTQGAYNESSNGSYDACITLIDKELGGISVGVNPEINTHEQSSLTLFQNYPNPINNSTTISFYLPEASHVNIDIYSMFGRKIASLVDKHYLAGRHTVLWNGKNQSGIEIERGIYLINLTAEKEIRTKSIVVL